MFGLRRTTRHKLPDRLRAGVVEVGLPVGSNGDILDRATWNHFGTDTIPSRPFLLLAIKGNERKYVQAMRTSASRILRGETSLRTVLSKIGIDAQGDVQEQITSLRAPPNSPATIKLKGSSNPLIDTGQMRQAITYRVRDR